MRRVRLGQSSPTAVLRTDTHKKYAKQSSRILPPSKKKSNSSIKQMNSHTE